MARAKRTVPRAGVHVVAPTAALFRAFLGLVYPQCAERCPDGSFTVLNESRWQEALSACEATEGQL